MASPEKVMTTRAGVAKGYTEFKVPRAAPLRTELGGDPLTFYWPRGIYPGAALLEFPGRPREASPVVAKITKKAWMN